MNVIFYGKTDIGVVRNNNEDSFASHSFPDGSHIFVVADGLGGHLAGEVASKTAVKTLIEMVKKGVGNDPIEFFNETFKGLNREIEILGSSDPTRRGMGTTLTVLYVREERAYIAHVGDSRAYRVSAGKIEQLTEDHSFVERLVVNGLINKEEARRHPRKNVLLQMIGMRKEVEPQLLGPLPVREGEKFLLCTDGLSNMVTDMEIREIMDRMGTQEAVEYLINIAKKRGGPDNITVIGVTFGDEAIRAKDTTPVETIVERSLEKSSRSKKRFLIFVLIFLLILLLGFGFYVFSLLREEKELGRKNSALIESSYYQLVEFQKGKQKS